MLYVTVLQVELMLVHKTSANISCYPISNITCISHLICSIPYLIKLLIDGLCMYDGVRRVYRSLSDHNRRLLNTGLIIFIPTQDPDLIQTINVANTNGGLVYGNYLKLKMRLCNEANRVRGGGGGGDDVNCGSTYIVRREKILLLSGNFKAKFKLTLKLS